MLEMKNATITSTMLGTESHGIFTFMLNLSYGGSGQGFGGWCLDTPLKDPDGKFIRRTGTALGMTYIMELLKCLEVDSWEGLKGVHVRVEADHNGIARIGHFLKDQWFQFEDHMTDTDHDQT